MVNVWATWCGYCIKELPDLEEINNRLAEKDCGIVGLMVDVDLDEETLQLGKDILKETGVTYLNILPWEGWETYIPENWPTSYFVDRDGYILTTPLKGARINVYEKRIDNLLKNK
ncbi:MAG: TlpA family protein disulfide reductase [Butyrivibrio sp.]|nr:TlpA family protein disulfide reductase [Butyrivibrio sp.]